MGSKQADDFASLLEGCQFFQTLRASADAAVGAAQKRMTDGGAVGLTPVLPTGVTL
jgi:hypothetical protein